MASCQSGGADANNQQAEKGEDVKKKQKAALSMKMTLALKELLNVEVRHLLPVLTRHDSRWRRFYMASRNIRDTKFEQMPSPDFSGAYLFRARRGINVGSKNNIHD